ncbi:MAG: sigma-70 family RNA polymerase sigma factor [Bacteroidetes bacterium]|nr:sigma-70 family RNA polymerase sigma factor [Bacteroidota bacterium]
MTKISHRETAEDIVQLVFENALVASRKQKEISSVKGWLFSILKNKIADHFRDQYRHPSHQSLEELNETGDFFDGNGNWKPESRPGQTDTGHLLDDPEFTNILQRCINALPPRMNAVVQLKYIDDRESTLIIDELGLSANNFWQLMHRAKLQLRQCIEKHWFK